MLPGTAQSSFVTSILTADGKITPTRAWTLRLGEYYQKNVTAQRSLALNGEKFEGIVLPALVGSKDIIALREQVVPRQDDVFIATFPKCGTTWMQQIVKLIWNKGNEDGRDVDEALPWIDTMKPAEIEALPLPRGFKTHLPYHLCPGGEPSKSPAKYIYVYRNPKDAMVSNYHFTIKYLPEDIPWDDYFEMLMSGEVYYGNIIDHFRGWLIQKGAPNILFISYESLKRDPFKSVNEVAKFLGYNLTEAVATQIVDMTSFDKMKENPSANNNWMNKVRREGEPFMRKGVIGDWKTLFSEDQSARIDKMVAEKLADIDIVFDYGN